MTEWIAKLVRSRALLVLVFSPRLFSGFRPAPKPTFMNSNSIGDPKASGQPVERLLSVT